MHALDMGSKGSAEVIDHPAVVKEKAEKAAKKAKRAEEAAEVTAKPFDDADQAGQEVLGAYEAKERARESRTAVGKRFADRVKTANEALKTALSEDADSEVAKLSGQLAKAKARVKSLSAEYEEAAGADKGPIGKAYRKRDAVLEERAKAKETAGQKVTKTAERFEKVMEQLRLTFPA